MGHKLSKSKEPQCAHLNLNTNQEKAFAICMADKYILLIECVDCGKEVRQEIKYDTIESSK